MIMLNLGIGLSDWAVDLKDVGAIYPLQGLEVPMAIAGFAFYVIWQIWQIGHENAELKKLRGHIANKESNDAIDRY